MTHATAIVLVAPGTDFISVAINRATGCRGWSHCFVDLGWRGDGDPIVIDISRQLGVQLSTFTRASEGRPVRRIPLSPSVGRHVVDELSRRLGRPYNLVAMALQPLQLARLGGTYCSTVIADALPAELRALLPTCPCPADLLALEEVLACSKS